MGNGQCSIVSESLQSPLCLDRGVTTGSGGNGVQGRPFSISDGNTAGRSGRSGEIFPACTVLPNADVIEAFRVVEVLADDSGRCCSVSICCNWPPTRGLCSGRYSRCGLDFAARMRFEYSAITCA